MGRCESCKKLTTQKGITFHRFPTNESERKKWTRNMEKPDWIPVKTAVLCSEHFTSDCFERWWNITRLRKGSVPTVFQKDTSQALKNANEVQVPYKNSISVPSNHSSCAQTASSIGEILHLTSPEISIPCHSTSTASTSCRKQLTSRISHLKEIVSHDHHYEDTPRTRQRKLISLRQKYASSKKTVKALQRKVKNLRTTVSSLRRVIKHQKAVNTGQVAT